MKDDYGWVMLIAVFLAALGFLTLLYDLAVFVHTF